MFRLMLSKPEAQARLENRCLACASGLDRNGQPEPDRGLRAGISSQGGTGVPPVRTGGTPVPPENCLDNALDFLLEFLLTVLSCQLVLSWRHSVHVNWVSGRSRLAAAAGCSGGASWVHARTEL